MTLNRRQFFALLPFNFGANKLRSQLNQAADDEAKRRHPPLVFFKPSAVGPSSLFPLRAGMVIPVTATGITTWERLDCGCVDCQAAKRGVLAPFKNTGLARIR